MGYNEDNMAISDFCSKFPNKIDKKVHLLHSDHPYAFFPSSFFGALIVQNMIKSSRSQLSLSFQTFFSIQKKLTLVLFHREIQVPKRCVLEIMAKQILSSMKFISLDRVLFSLTVPSPLTELPPNEWMEVVVEYQPTTQGETAQTVVETNQPGTPQSFCSPIWFHGLSGYID